MTRHGWESRLLAHTSGILAESPMRSVPVNCVILCEGRGSLADREEQQVAVWEGETWSVATKIYVVSRSAQKKNMWVRRCGP